MRVSLFYLYLVIAMTTDVFDAQIVLSKTKVVTYQNVKEEATAVI